MFKNISELSISSKDFIKYKKWGPINLFSSEELKLYNELLNYFNPKNIFVLSKIRLADLVDKEEIIEYKERQSVFMKLSQKHIDFVLTDTNGKILCLIELDGYSHIKDKKTIKNDKFKEAFFGVIGIPLIRYNNYKYHNLSLLDKYTLNA